MSLKKINVFEENMPDPLISEREGEKERERKEGRMDRRKEGRKGKLG